LVYIWVKVLNIFPYEQTHNLKNVFRKVLLFYKKRQLPVISVIVDLNSCINCEIEKRLVSYVAKQFFIILKLVRQTMPCLKY
jgi:hypothetical protein